MGIYILSCSSFSDQKEFDAFVSYAKWSPFEREASSSLTEENLALNLLPDVLENKYGYTLCLLERDVTPGGGRSAAGRKRRRRATGMHRHALSVLSSVLSLGLGEGFMSLDHPGQEHRKPCVAETCSIVGGGGVGWGIHLRKKKKKNWSPERHPEQRYLFWLLNRKLVLSSQMSDPCPSWDCQPQTQHWAQQAPRPGTHQMCRPHASHRPPLPQRPPPRGQGHYMPLPHSSQLCSNEF